MQGTISAATHLRSCSATLTLSVYALLQKASWSLSSSKYPGQVLRYKRKREKHVSECNDKTSLRTVASLSQPFRYALLDFRHSELVFLEFWFEFSLSASSAEAGRGAKDFAVHALNERGEGTKGLRYIAQMPLDARVAQLCLTIQASLSFVHGFGSEIRLQANTCFSLSTCRRQQRRAERQGTGQTHIKAIITDLPRNASDCLV